MVPCQPGCNRDALPQNWSLYILVLLLLTRVSHGKKRGSL